jgi:hypothetical protein
MIINSRTEFLLLYLCFHITCFISVDVLFKKRLLKLIILKLVGIFFIYSELYVYIVVSFMYFLEDSMLEGSGVITCFYDDVYWHILSY